MLSKFLKTIFSKTPTEENVARITFVLDKNMSVRFNCEWNNNDPNTSAAIGKLLYEINHGSYIETILKDLTHKAIDNNDDKNFIASIVVYWNHLASAIKEQKQDPPLVQPLGAFFKNVKHTT